MSKVLSFTTRRERMMRRIKINNVDVKTRTVTCCMGGEVFTVRQARKGNGWRKVFIIVGLPARRVLTRLENQALYKAAFEAIKYARAERMRRAGTQLSLFSFPFPGAS